MIVFNADGPARRKAKFEPGTHGGTPTGSVNPVEFHTSKIKAPEAIANHRSAALRIEEHTVPSIAHLAW